jgi:hypothetical protein
MKAARLPSATVILDDDGRVQRVSGVYPKPKPKIESTPEMRDAHRAAYEREEELRSQIEIVTRQETTKRRIKNKLEEIERVEQTRTTQIETFVRRTERLVLSTDGHTREVRKVATTAAHLEKHGNLTRDLAIYLHQFAQRVAEGHGAATEDGHDSTSRMTCSYEPSGGGGFGSKTPSDRQLNGLACLQQMRKQIPRELIPVFDQIVNEEVSGWHDRKMTLAEIGAMIGYKHKQSSAAGGALVYAVCTMVAHFLRNSRYLALDSA